MFKKIIITVSFILISVYGMAQKDINNYKYIMVPKSFEFSDSEDQYQLNSLLHFLFNKYGYIAYFAGDDLPEDLKNNRCLALSSDVQDVKGGLFKTKLEINLKDCFGNTVMTSQIGESREKAYNKAYTEALRNAFETFQNFDYKYIAVEDGNSKSLKAEVTTNTSELSEAVKSTEKVEEIIDEVTEVDDKTRAVLSKQDISQMYYAQLIKSGYQLVNSEPKIVMVLLNTAVENVFLVKGKSAIVFKEGESWYYSENNGELKQKTAMNIKF